MAPHKIEFYIYAENEDEVKEVQKAANNFVSSCYQQGAIVSAKKLTSALIKFKDNIFVRNFLR